MRLDLEALIPSILFGSFIFIVILATNLEMAHNFGSTEVQNNTVFNMNRTMTQALAVQSNVSSTGLTSVVSSFFPGANSLFKIFDITKAAIADLRDAISTFATYLPGNKYIALFISIVIITIGIAIAFIILNSFFRIGGGFKQY